MYTVKQWVNVVGEDDYLVFFDLAPIEAIAKVEALTDMVEDIDTMVFYATNCKEDIAKFQALGLGDDDANDPAPKKIHNIIQDAPPTNVEETTLAIE